MAVSLRSPRILSFSLEGEGPSQAGSEALLVIVRVGFSGRFSFPFFQRHRSQALAAANKIALCICLTLAGAGEGEEKVSVIETLLKTNAPSLRKGRIGDRLGGLVEPNYLLK